MKKINILIIDDHPAMRHGIAQLIEKERDFTVCGEAGGREDTLALLQHQCPDLAILDIGLSDSGYDGLDLISEIHAIVSDLPVLIYSMYDEKVYAERALNLGADGYLMKQEPVQQIVVAIRQILNEGIYLSDTISRKIIFDKMKRTKASSAPDACLSQREFEIFSFIGKGHQPRDIAKTLCLSVKTVETHRTNIRKKMNIDTASELTRYAIHWVHQSDNK